MKHRPKKEAVHTRGYAAYKDIKSTEREGTSAVGRGARGGGGVGYAQEGTPVRVSHWRALKRGGILHHAPGS